jgi:hypothetical protein
MPVAVTGKVGRERAVMLGVWGLAVLGCVLGLATPPGTHNGLAGRGIDLLHITGTAALAVTIVLGPGIALRTLHRPPRLELGFLALPGLALLVATACLAWALAGLVEAWVVCLAILAALLAWLPARILRSAPGPLLEREEGRALLIVGLVLCIALAKSVWSVNPLWGLYGGTISTTLEVGGRSDSRIPFTIVQLIAQGAGPFSDLAKAYFTPFDFSSRGPLAGLASAPLVFAAGGRPPADLPNQPWMPFDPQGFMAFRIAAMVFASTAFLSLWTLIRTLGGTRAARFGLLLAATTPFLLHEVWFTWPKLFAASFVILSATRLIGGRPGQAGLLAGAAYLVHPGTLLYAPVLVVMALWPFAGAQLRRPRLRSAAFVVLGVTVWLVGWRLINGSHYTQTGFLDYLTQAGWGEQPTLHNWLFSRLESLRNTFVPLTPYFLTDDLDTGVVRGQTDNVIYFFMQYWIGVPFGLAIVFFPLLLASLWRAARRWPWPVLLTVGLPLAGFAVYWPFREGMLRENLHAWVLAVIAVVALQQRAAGFPWLRRPVFRAVLCLRAAEVLAVAVVPTIASNRGFLSPQYDSTDILALLVMVGASVALAVLVWRERPPAPVEAEPGRVLAEAVRA